MSNQIKNDELIGKRFGRLTVVQRNIQAQKNDRNNGIFYDCLCDCGNHRTIRKSGLLAGKYPSCGCWKREVFSQNSRKNFIDLTGQRFGKLVITRRKKNSPDDPIKTHREGVWWYADCDCGAKDVIVKGNYLRAGRVKSCGCYNAEASHKKNTIDISGQKYGMLTVIREALDINGKPRKSPGGSILWECQCECGNNTIVSSNALRTGNTVSCGCVSSKHEMQIRKHLQALQIKYAKQFYFDDLRSPITGWILRFDVAVFDRKDKLSFIIEYDGEQHDYGTRFSSNPEVNEQKLRRTKIYDKMKDEYCQKNNIDLLRISYKDKDNLLEIIDKKLIQKGLINDGICKS